LQAMTWITTHIPSRHIFVDCDDGQGNHATALTIQSFCASHPYPPATLPWPTHTQAYAKGHWPEDTYHMCCKGLEGCWANIAQSISTSLMQHCGPLSQESVLIVADSSFTAHDYAWA
jgi:hypothetical protein